MCQKIQKIIKKGKGQKSPSNQVYLKWGFTSVRKYSDHLEFRNVKPKFVVILRVLDSLSRYKRLVNKIEGGKVLNLSQLYKILNIFKILLNSFSFQNKNKIII